MSSPTWFMVLFATVAIGCDPAPPPFAESCQNIIDACHDLDPGTGRAAECHDTAHDEATAEACDPIEVECVAACEALAHGDGGTQQDAGGHHHHQDGGHADHDGGH